MDGFIVLDKAEGLTSFKAAAVLRRSYGAKKIGHTGTLDPMATGVLPVALGKATRFIDFLPDENKEYVAALLFGVTTDTLDRTGAVLSRTEANVSEADLLSVLPAFTGEIDQIPPMYSALSVNGQRLYDLARQGVEVERKPRRVTVRELEYLGQTGKNEFKIRVACSKGTYIRTLIDDIGKQLGPGAVMTALRRTAANGFTEAEAKTEETLKSLLPAPLPVDAPFAALSAVTVSEKQAVRFINGNDLALSRLPGFSGEGLTRVYAPDKTFLGLGMPEPDADALRPRRVLRKDES